MNIRSKIQVFVFFTKIIFFWDLSKSYHNFFWKQDMLKIESVRSPNIAIFCCEQKKYTNENRTWGLLIQNHIFYKNTYFDKWIHIYASALNDCVLTAIRAHFLPWPRPGQPHAWTAVRANFEPWPWSGHTLCLDRGQGTHHALTAVQADLGPDHGPGKVLALTAVQA